MRAFATDHEVAESPSMGESLVWRFLAGAAASFLLITGAFLIWQGRAQESAQLPPAPPPRPAILAESIPEPPQATAKSREEKRFDRADRNNDGQIMLEELLQPRRKPFAKLDSNGDGHLSFEEWAHSTIDKFQRADSDRNGRLTRAEYATTAPPPPKKKPRCGC
jgi:hypothetical protein